MEIADELSDDFIMKYVSPAVGTIVGISIGCLKYLLTWDKKKEENKFKYVALNGTISAVNSSFGVIYTYFDDLGYFTNIKTFKITKGISFYLTKFTKIVSKFLTKIFHVAIGTHTVAAIGCAIAVNLLIRIAKTLYMIIKEYYGEKINLLKIDVVAEHKVNPILSKYGFEKTDTVEYKNNPITGKIKYDKTELVEFNNNPIICDSKKENKPKKK